MFEGGQTPIKIISLLFQFQSLRRALCSTPPARSLVEAMAAAALKDKLNAHVADMVATGLLDGQSFQQLQKLCQDEDTPSFVAELVQLFCNEADPVIGTIKQQLEMPVVDFDSLTVTIHQLKGSSASVGAQKVVNASIHLSDLCRQMDRDGCLRALRTARGAFYEVRRKFQTMIQLVQQIQNLS